MSKEVLVTIKTDTKDTDKKLKSVNTNLKKTEVQAKESGETMSSAFNALPGSIQGVIGNLKNLGTSFKAIAVGAGVGAIAGLGSLFVSATKRGAEFAKSLSGLEAVLGASDSEMKQLSSSAKELGSSTQFTSKQVVELQTEFAKLGFSTKEILASTKATLDLAASLDVGLGEAAAIAGSTLRAFGLEAEETQRVVDVMASSTSKSALDYGSLRESLKLVAPTSRAMNVSIEETTALLATLADNGLKGSVAGTGLSKTFIELNKKGIPLNEALEKIQNSSNQLNDAIELVGVVGSKSLLTLANNAPKIDTLTNAFNNSQGAAQRLAETRLDNLAGDTTKLSSAWEGFLLSIEDGTGIFNKIARGIVQATTALLNFITPTDKLSESLEKERDELFLVQARLNDVNTSQEERNTIIANLQKQYPKYLENINSETVSNEELNKAIEKINESLINKILIQQKEEEIQEQAEEAADALNDKIEARADLLKRESEIRQELSDAGIKVQAKNAEELVKEIDKIIHEQNRLRKLNGSNVIKSFNDLRKQQDGLKRDLKALASAEEEFNEEQEETSKLLSAKDQLMKDLGVTTEDLNEKTETGIDDLNDEIDANEEKNEVTRDTIKLLEKELQAVRNREAISDLEIAQRNDEVKAIQEKINKLRELSVEQINFQNQEDQEVPRMENRGASLLRTEKTYREELTNMGMHYGQVATDQVNKDAKDHKDAQERKRQADLDYMASRTTILKMGLDSIIQNTEAESKINKAALIAKQVILAQELIMEAKRTITFATQSGARASVAVAQGAAETAKVGFPQNIPLLFLYAAQAVGIVSQIRRALQKAKAPASIGNVNIDTSTGSGSETTTDTQPPNFNVVGTSGFNQIAGALGQQEPIQAFVVSGDVTTAQELQNNTIQQATF